MNLANRTQRENISDNTKEGDKNRSLSPKLTSLIQEKMHTKNPKVRILKKRCSIPQNEIQLIDYN